MQRARQVILIATGEEEERYIPPRRIRLTPERRSELARKAALKRWHPDA